MCVGLRRLIAFFGVLGFMASLLLSALPAAADDYTYYFKTWVQYAYPQQYSNEVAWIQLCNDRACTSPITGAAVHTVWNYRTTTSYSDWYTGSDGRAAMIRNISDATCGFTVRVDIYVFDDQEQIDSAFFTPCSNNSYSAPVYNQPTYTQPTYTQPTYTQPTYTQPSQPSYSAPSGGGGPVSGSYGSCPAGYPIKGNDSSGIYHVPGQQYYAVTNARNCFASEADAQAAGYRRSKV